MLRKSTAGAALVLALALCAVVTASASAAGPTAYVCAPVTNGPYSDSHCKTKGTPGIADTLKISATSEATATPVEAQSEGPYTLKSTNAGVEFEISCTTIASTNGKVWNVVGEPMKAEGRLSLTYTGCTVVKPAGKSCVVRSKEGSVETANGTIKTLPLKSTSTMPSEKINKTEFSPVTPESFVNIVVASCTTTALNGEKIVKGQATAESNEETDASLLTFSSTSGSSLTFATQPATYTGKNRIKMSGTEETIALETKP